MVHKDISSRESLFHHTPEHDHFLFEGLEFPADRERLVRFVTDAESDADTQNLIRSLPDRVYENQDDVWRSIGEASRRFGVGGRDLGQERDDLGKQMTARSYHAGKEADSSADTDARSQDS